MTFTRLNPVWRIGDLPKRSNLNGLHQLGKDVSAVYRNLLQLRERHTGFSLVNVMKCRQALQLALLFFIR